MTALAADATLRINGEVLASTCTVTPGTNSSDASGDISVTLPTIGVDSLPTAEAKSGAKAFQVVIGGSGQTGCIGTGAGSKASIAFDTVGSASAINQVTGRLVNSGTATNVEVGLVNPLTGQDINVYTNSNVPQVTIVDNTAVIDLGAQYVATGAAAGEGSVDTAVGFSVAYF